MDKKENLDPELERVAFGKGTEAPFSGKYWNEHKKGTYKCAVCGAMLFASETKFDSGTGWPSFRELINMANVVLKADTSHGMDRTEVSCRNCGAHLGHIFDDLSPFAGQTGQPKKNGKRYCINSVCFIPSLINHSTRIPEFWLQNFVSRSPYLDMTRAPTRFSPKIQKFVKCESVN